MISFNCHICHQMRPENMINVFKTDISEEHGLPAGTMGHNVNYCADNPDCAEKAKTYRHLRRQAPTENNAIMNGE